MKYDKGALMKIVELYLNKPDVHCIEFNNYREEILNKNKGKVENTIKDDEDHKIIARLVWNKEKFVFNYDIITLDKKTNKPLLKFDSAHNLRHADDEEFKMFHPSFTLYKIEHPMLKLIIDSMPQEKQNLWKEKLCQELFIAYEMWNKTLENQNIDVDNNVWRKELNSLMQKVFRGEVKWK